MVGVSIASIGGLLVAVQAAIDEPLARGLDLAIGAALIALGALMTIRSRTGRARP